MPDYSQAAAAFKARLDTKNKKIADFHIFFEEIRASLFTEAEMANAALTNEVAPRIELTQGWPDGPLLQLVLGTASEMIQLDHEKPTIAALIKGESGEATVTYLIDAQQSPLTASRVSLDPANEPKLAPSAIAASFVEALIQGAP